MNLYKQSDKYKEKLKKKLREEFNSLIILSFDEMNILNIRKKAKKIYEDIDNFNKKSYIEIFGYAVQETQKTLTFTERKKVKAYSKKDIGEMIEYYLALVNPVTGYLYENELERKRLRFVEEVLTSREVDSRERLIKSAKRAADLVYTQSMQYADGVSDFAERTVLEQAGVKKVVWNAEKDEKTCTECASKDGNVYEITDTKELSKPHYHCRCYLTPYRGK